MGARFFAAPEVEELARPIIRQHHQNLVKHNVRIEFVFRDDIPTSNGHAVWGTARKVTGLNAYLRNVEDASMDREDLNQPFFVITITHKVWTRLNARQKTALVDHELMHCDAYIDDKEEIVLALVGHDFEGFNEELRRYGLWRESAKDLADAIEDGKQEKLFAVPPQSDGPRERLEPDTYHRADVDYHAAQH